MSPQQGSFSLASGPGRYGGSGHQPSTSPAVWTCIAHSGMPSRCTWWHVLFISCSQFGTATAASTWDEQTSCCLHTCTGRGVGSPCQSLLRNRSCRSVLSSSRSLFRRLESVEHLLETARYHPAVICSEFIQFTQAELCSESTQHLDWSSAPRMDGSID